MKDRRYEDLRFVEFRQRSEDYSGAIAKNGKPCYALVHDDTDCVIEKTLAENDRIELGVDLVLLKDGKNGHRIGSRQRRTEYQTFQQGDVQRF